MSSSITLSAATRQNLLSLQDTADLLATTQTRLSTGKKVNSALDNPTNFFTSQSLTARSSDLSALLDGMSNGVQVIQAANQGITSIQKLLDTAKSTAQQALADKTGGSSGVTGGASAQAAKVTGAATLASLGTSVNGATTFDLSSAANNASLDISLDGGATKTTIRLDKTTLASAGGDLTKITSDQLLTAINGQIAASSALKGNVSASFSADGRITFATTTTGAAAQLKVSGSANSTIDLGYGKSTTVPTAATVTANATLAATTDFSTGSASLVVSDGNTSVQVSLDKTSAVDNLGNTIGASGTQTEVIAAINKQLQDKGSTATVTLGSGANANKLVFSSSAVGPDAQLSVIGGLDTTGGNGANGIGFSTFTASTPTAGAAAINTTGGTVGTAASTTAVLGTSSVKGSVTFGAVVPASSNLGAGQSTSFTVNDTVNNKTVNITINKDTVFDNAGDKLGTTGVSSANILSAIQRQMSAAGSNMTVSLSGGQLKFENAAVGAGSDPTVTTAGNNLTDQIGLFSTPTTTTAGVISANTDLSGGKSATFTVSDGTTDKTISIDATATDNSGQAIGSNPNQQSLVQAINNKLAGSKYSAYIDSASNKLTFVAADNATTQLTIKNASDTIGLGLGTANTLTETGQVSTPSVSSAASVHGATVTPPFALTATATTFTVGDGTNTANIAISPASLDKSGNAIGTAPTQAKVAEAIQAQLDSQGVNATAGFTNNQLTFTSKGVGSAASVTVTPGTDGTGGASLGLGAAGASNPPLTASGVDAGNIDLSKGKSSTFSISDGTTTKSVTISATSLDKSGNPLGASATQARVAEAIQAQLNTGGVKATVGFVNNKLTVTSNAVGTGAASPTLTASSDTAGLGLGTTTTTSSASAAGTGTPAAGVSASGTAATDGSSQASIVGTDQTAYPTRDFSGTKDASFTLQLGSGPMKLITLNSSTFGSSTTTSQSAIAKAINDQINADTGLAGKVSASYVNNKLVISTTASGSDQKLAVSAAQVTAGGVSAVDIGFGISGSGATTQTANGTDVGGSKGVSSVRSTLATQFNQILQQISQQAQDSGYNGINLLYRDSNNAADNTLHITFNEKNTSALDIQGVKFDANGLGLNTVSGNFQTDTEVSTAIDAINTATSQLRTQSTAFGSNLTVVQNRQDFTKAMTNILDTGSANLTNADLNEEAANSQALSTRNSLAISALSLANQAQQGILQLLR